MKTAWKEFSWPNSKTKFFDKKNYFLTKTVLKRLKSLKTCLEMTKPPNSTKTENWSKQLKLIKKTDNRSKVILITNNQ